MICSTVKGWLWATAETIQKSKNADSFLAVFISGNDTAEMGKSGHRVIGSSGHRVIGSSGKSRLGDLQRIKGRPYSKFIAENAERAEIKTLTTKGTKDHKGI